ncbi:MAG: hypothetical protein CMM92_04635 [Rickettsiales bacterium]|nr:hypothetical protein [Rickettsiales bacterium]|tara:strand:+ start:95 stop:199 length:105 start_codon:yes stop_codon:yes gene_type:complete
MYSSMDKKKKKNIALGLFLFALAAIFYCVTLLKF